MSRFNKIEVNIQSMKWPRTPINYTLETIYKLSQLDYNMADFYHNSLTPL